MNITAYSDELRVAAGDSLCFRVSSATANYEARLVRLIHGDRNPEGPGFKAVHVASNIDGRHSNGAVQSILKGSFATIEGGALFPALDAFSFMLWAWPTIVGGQRQTLMSYGDAVLVLDLAEDGCIEVRTNDIVIVRTDFPLRARSWVNIALRVNAQGEVILDVRPLDTRHRAIVETKTKGSAELTLWPAGKRLTFAALEQNHARFSFFNGKLENPVLFDGALADDEIAGSGAMVLAAKSSNLVGAWDFARRMTTSEIEDISGRGRHGCLFNQPTRGMTGHNWSGWSHDFREVPDQYGAIHFHEDDLGDCGWPESFVLDVPHDTQSGIYAIHLQTADGEDYVPFAITPGIQSKRARIAFLMPTLTYLAYGNEAIANRPDIKAMMKAAGIDGAAAYPAQKEDCYIVEHGLLSCYDIHADGSGVCYSSKKRPLLNMRPSYLMPLHGLAIRPGGAAHLLAVDLYITDWLEAQGFAFDVITDEDLDAGGKDALAPYDVILTGSHPEYHTQSMMDGMSAYLNDGGRLMYLGGNGFFWVTSFTSDGASIETRRSRTVRPWTAFAAEERHASTKELGGAWKYRARPAQAMVGVGTTAVGFTSGQPYEILEAGRQARFQWIFDGVNGPIGAFPNLIYGIGAAGWEIDRADVNLGTPLESAIVASARIEDDSYQQVVDELEAAGGHTGGTQNPNVRADMVYTPFPNGGAVFAVGSCMWAGSLYYNCYENSVSKVTYNVLQGFLER